MVRLVTESDTGLKVLRNAPPETEATQIIDIVAIHGLGAHPDDSWCKNVGTDKEPQWFNWLVEDSMLPSVAQNARIMRYGYQSEWFGKEAMQQSVSTVADRLLRALKRKRKDVTFRPLLFVAHCFGGLVVLKALIEAEQYPNEWPGIFKSTTGLVFFGTPFRGAEGMNQMEMLDAARRDHNEDQIQPAILDVLQPGNAYLKDLVDDFLKKMRGQAHKIQIVCFFELKSSNIGGIVGKQDRIRLVVTEHAGCLDLSESVIKRSLSRTHFNMNKFGSAEEEDFELVAEVIEDMVNASPELVSARSQYSGKHKVEFSLHGIPIVGHFVQRAVDMEKLEWHLLDGSTEIGRQNVVVLHGLGGIGKTQLAVAFARKHHGRFSSIFWLDGSSEESLKQSFANIVGRLPRTELTASCVEMLSQTSINLDEAVRECLQWLCLPTNRQWLLIFDNVDRDYPNADDPQAYDVKNYLPNADYGSILITSRLARVQERGWGIKVGTVDTEQARAMLESNAGRKIEDADIILDRLKGLPLALTQAGSYLQETNMSALAYVEHYDNTWERLMQSQGRYPLQEYGDRNVLTTWAMSYEQVKKQNEGAALLLKLWGFLDHGELWYELVAASSKIFITPGWLSNIAGDELAYAEALGLLTRYSLADAKEGSNSHSMHLVLHQWCGRLAEGDECYKLGYIAAGMVAVSVPHDWERESWRTRKRLLGHAAIVARWLTGIHTTRQEIGGDFIKSWVYHDLGYLFAYEDRLMDAEVMFDRVMQQQENEELNKQILGTMRNMGMVYKNQGKLYRAEAMYERVLQGYKNIGEEPSASLLASMGALYRRQGHLDRAETMYNRALQREEEEHGLEHPSTLLVVNNLGVIYSEQGRFDEAEATYKRVLQKREKEPGPKHPDTLITVHNLGRLYYDQGRLGEAEAIYKRCLQGREEKLGSEHPSTLDTVYNLGLLYYDQGRLGEAEAIYKRCLQGREEKLGSEHPSTLDTVHNLGLLYYEQGRLDEAEALQIRVLEGYENGIEPENLSTHTPTLNAMWSLGAAYASQKRVEEARVLFNKALAGYEEAKGPDHSKCHNLRYNMALLDAAQQNAHPPQIESPTQTTSNTASTSTESPESNSDSELPRVSQDTTKDPAYPSQIELPAPTASNPAPTSTESPETKPTSK